MPVKRQLGRPTGRWEYNKSKMCVRKTGSEGGD